MSSNETLRFYDDNAAKYAADASGEIQRRQVRAFAKRLEQGARVLDLGSGGGHDAASLIELGFDVTLLDGSSGLAKEAEREPGRAVRVLRFEELDYVEAFDGIWAAASLHHVRFADLSEVMTRVVQALMPSGLLFATFKEADEDWHDIFGRFFAAMTEDRLRAISTAAGLQVERIERSQAIGRDGRNTTWLAMTAHKNAERAGHSPPWTSAPSRGLPYPSNWGVTT